jgi:ATP-binding cassette subfamily B protein
LYENIALALGESTENETAKVFRAAQVSGGDQIAKVTAQGYQTCLSSEFQGGIDLSGGQWQKIALARAFVRDSEIICMDEPTASLAPKAEQALFTQIFSLMEDKTAIIRLPQAFDYSHGGSNISTGRRVLDRRGQSQSALGKKRKICSDV